MAIFCWIMKFYRFSVDDTLIIHLFQRGNMIVCILGMPIPYLYIKYKRIYTHVTSYLSPPLFLILSHLFSANNFHDEDPFLHNTGLWKLFMARYIYKNICYMTYRSLETLLLLHYVRR